MTQHGGRREGAGRPKGKKFSAQVHLMLTPEQKAKLLALGGTAWIRKTIDSSQVCETTKKETDNVTTF